MNNKVIKFISLIQIIGGILGILISFQFLILLLLPTNLFILLVFLLSLIAGIWLWQEKKLGYLLTYIVQILQVPYIVTNVISYSIVSGLQLAFIIEFSSQILNLNTRFWIGSNANFSIFNEVPFSALGFNIVPLIIILYLVNYQLKQKRQKEDKEYVGNVYE